MPWHYSHCLHIADGNTLQIDWLAWAQAFSVIEVRDQGDLLGDARISP
jgi:hypothetical protein